LAIPSPLYDLICTLKKLNQTKRYKMKLNALVFVLFVALFTGGVHASLVMQIDTANDQFRITGSDSGTAGYYDVPGIYLAAWLLISEPAGTLTSYEDSSSDIFSESFAMEAFKLDYSVTYPEVSVAAYDYGDFTTVTGSGIWVDYSSMDEATKTDFEGLIGEALPWTEVYGSAGWSDMTVQAIPEPATAGLLGISIGALWLFRRAKNHYRS
jgi:hypothetical protein